MSFYSGTPKFCLGLLLFLLEESRTPVFKILVRSLVYTKNEQKILLAGIYRSPNSSLENTQKMLDLINTACSGNYISKIIIGDFNIPEIDWVSLTTVKSETHYSFGFLECLRDNYLEQLVFMPTRWRDQQPGNLLDLVITDCEDNILNLETTNHLGNSDHLSIEFYINCYTEKFVNKIEKRNFYRADYVLANQKLSNIDWKVLHDMNQQEGWEYFYTNVNQVVEECVPKVKSSKCKPKPAWMDSYCIKLNRKKKKAWKRYSHSRNWQDYYKYCAIRNKATRAIRFAKR